MKIIIILLFFSFSIHSEDYLTYYTKPNNGVDSHFISKLDLNTGILSKTIHLGNLNNSNSLLGINKENKLFSVFLQTENRLDEVAIFDKKTFAQVAKIQVPKIKWPDSDMFQVSPISISKDDEQLIVISSGNSNKELNIYNIKSGENIYKRKLGKHNYKVSKSKDLNYLIFESISSKNSMLIVIDIKNHKTSAIISLGSSEFKTHLFQNSLFISTEHSPVKNKYYSLEKLDFESNKKIKYQEKSLSHFVFDNDEEQQSLFVAGRNIKKKKDLFIMELDNNSLLNKTDYKKKIKPIKAVLNSSQNKLMIIGEFKLATIDTEKNVLLSRIRIPFDPLDGFMNKEATIAYIQEGYGSQVGSFDLVRGELIEQSSAGRFFNKVLILSRKVLLVGLLTDYIIFDVMLKYRYSTKNMMLDNTGNKLLVINSTTNDLTIFDAKTLKKVKSKGTGSKTFLMSQASKDDSPVLIIGEKRLSLMDIKTNTIVLKLNKAQLKGLDNNNGILFYEINNRLHIYNMYTQKELSRVDNANVFSVYTY